MRVFWCQVRIAVHHVARAVFKNGRLFNGHARHRRDAQTRISIRAICHVVREKRRRLSAGVHHKASPRGRFRRDCQIGSRVATRCHRRRVWGRGAFPNSLAPTPNTSARRDRFSPCGVSGLSTYRVLVDFHIGEWHPRTATFTVVFVTLFPLLTCVLQSFQKNTE